MRKSRLTEEQMMADLKEWLASFGQLLHEDNTRLIECGRLPALARRERGERRSETLAFLGVTLYCGWTRDGRFIVKHKTQSHRLTRRLKGLRQEAWPLRHTPLAAQHPWYSSLLRGHYGYFGMPHNWRSLNDVSAGIKLTHLAGVKLIHLGKDGGQEAADVDPGGSSGDPSFGKTRGKSSGDSAADGLFAQHGAAISA